MLSIIGVAFAFRVGISGHAVERQWLDCAADTMYLEICIAEQDVVPFHSFWNNRLFLEGKGYVVTGSHDNELVINFSQQRQHVSIPGDVAYKWPKPRRIHCGVVVRYEWFPSIVDLRTDFERVLLLLGSPNLDVEYCYWTPQIQRIENRNGHKGT